MDALLLKTKLLTWDDFRNLDVEEGDMHFYELINGTIVKRTAPSLHHQRASGNLFTYMNVFIKAKKIGTLFAAPVDVFIDEYNGYQPDICFVSSERSFLIEAGDYIRSTPDLVVEIISPGSVRHDRVDKKANYEKYAVRELWLIDPLNRSVEIYVMQGNAYQTHAFQEKEGEVTSTVLEGFAVDIKDIFE